jgi:MFS transporter, DHA1 family, inner membrane transport protein
MYSLSESHERRLLWLLMFTQFTLIMDFMVMMPLGPQIMQAFHISPAQFAAAVSAYSWCAGLSGLLGAAYIDRFDRRKLMLAAYAMFALSNLACALTDSYSLLLLSRAFAGLSGGVLGSIVMAIIADVIPASRRGAATGTVMTAFSIASVIGVPAGVLLGAHFSWSAPFWLLTVLSAVIWFGGSRVLPKLDQHLSAEPVPISQALPNVIKLFANPRHMNAFVLTFIVTVSHMLVIPFIAPTLVANHGIAPENLSWMYMAGGAATFFTARAIGKLADRHGMHFMFRALVLLSLLPVLLVTHLASVLPNVSIIGMLLLFPFFMVLVSGRMVPLQALLTTVPQPAQRGAFLSANNAVQALGIGCGAWIGGMMLSAPQAGGKIAGYGAVGWVAAIVALCAVLWVSRVTPAGESPAASPLSGAR